MREFAEREVTETRRIETGATCDRCQRVLGSVRVFRDEPPREDTHGMYDGAARIVIEGWYGGFLDPMHRGPAFDLCEGCCVDLLAFLGMTVREFFDRSDT